MSVIFPKFLLVLGPWKVVDAVVVGAFATYGVVVVVVLSVVVEVVALIVVLDVAPSGAGAGEANDVADFLSCFLVVVACVVVGAVVEAVVLASVIGGWVVDGADETVHGIVVGRGLRATSHSLLSIKPS